MIAAAVAVAGAAAFTAPAAQAGVTSCSAQGGKQEAGALIGAALGGLLGNSVSGHNRTTGTVVGAAVGAAAGSAVGCQMQHQDPAQRARYDREDRFATYVSGGYRLSSQIEPARFSRMGQLSVINRDFGLRAAPDFSSRYVGKLKGGERVDAMAHVRGTDWILVGRNGVGMGYVHEDYIRPDNARYAYGY
ncbi:SH3 domain-containing protein [Phenylobacterium soli]|nr:SH3 domain-containing protein [Phenylobacterium soli]